MNVLTTAVKGYPSVLPGSNTWPSKGGARDSVRMREGLINWPGDTGKVWHTLASPSGLCLGSVLDSLKSKSRLVAVY